MGHENQLLAYVAASWAIVAARSFSMVQSTRLKLGSAEGVGFRTQVVRWAKARGVRAADMNVETTLS